MTRESEIDIDRFIAYYYLPAASFLVQNIITQDPELLEHYDKISQDYDATGSQLNSEIRNQVMTTRKQNNYTYKYINYKVVHYDHDAYKKRKSDYEKGIRKSKPDGKIECRVKEADLPSEVLSYLKSSQYQPNNAANLRGIRIVI